VYHGDGGGADIRHIAGWLIQEEELYGQSGRMHPREDTRPEDRNRRVIAAVHDVAEFGTAPVDVDLAGDLWQILAPGQPDPTDGEIEAAAARRIQSSSR
jgi:hypothetical protein